MSVGKGHWAQTSYMFLIILTLPISGSYTTQEGVIFLFLSLDMVVQ